MTFGGDRYKYLIIEGRFIDFGMNGMNMGIYYSPPYLDYSKRVWYKPWTWFYDPDIVLPEKSKIIFEIDGKNNVKYISLNDSLNVPAGKVSLLINQKTLHEIVGRK